MKSLYSALVTYVYAKAYAELNLAKVRNVSSDAPARGLSAPEQFYREWSAGRTPLPFVCCTAMQLYWAFQRWCHLNGERFPPTQIVFARTVLNVGFGDGVRKRVCEIAGKQRTVYVVDLLPDGVALDEWVESRTALFEESLRKYRNGHEAAEHAAAGAY